MPSFATGPIRDTVTTPAELDASNKQLFGYLTGAPAQTSEAAAKGPIIPVIDIRDVRLPFYNIFPLKPDMNALGL